MLAAGRNRVWWSFGAAALLLAGAGLLGGTGCLTYLVRAGCGQADILWKRRPVREVLADPNLPPRVRAGLDHVLVVQKFAADELALTPGSSYTLYSDIGRDAVAYNVVAAPELALRPHTYWFPIVGTVPYLGFFSKKEAIEKANELKRAGLETVVQPVSAYSTLGWFADPILSSQLSLSEFSLTRLVIHETAHATLWFPGDVRFNESFASFVELEGALSFYRKKYGESDPRYLKHTELLMESKQIRNIFRKRTQELDIVYKSKRTDAEKRIAKADLLEQLRQDLETNAPRFKHFNLRKISTIRYNNAHLLSYRLYGSGQTFFHEKFRASGRNWPVFLREMRTLKNLSADQRERLMRETK